MPDNLWVNGTQFGVVRGDRISGTSKRRERSCKCWNKRPINLARGRWLMASPTLVHFLIFSTHWTFKHWLSSTSSYSRKLTYHGRGRKRVRWLWIPRRPSSLHLATTGGKKNTSGISWHFHYFKESFTDFADCFSLASLNSCCGFALGFDSRVEADQLIALPRRQRNREPVFRDLPLRTTNNLVFYILVKSQARIAENEFGFLKRKVCVISPYYWNR